jgi:hypothetical protein
MIRSCSVRGAFVALVLIALAPVARAEGFGKLTPRDLALKEALETRVSLDYALPTDLAEIISFLNEAIALKTNVKDALMVDPRILATDPRPVKIVLQDTTVKRALMLILSQATSVDEENQNNELSFITGYQNAVIFISNKARLLRLNMARKEFRIYDIRDLLSAFPVGGPGGTGTTTGTAGTTTGTTPGGLSNGTP